MTRTTETTSKETADREIISSRLFSFPCDEVYSAFSDPAQLVHWWGPKDFTCTFHEFDLRPGGRWHLTLHGPDGAQYENEKRFLEVLSGERIVFEHLQSMHNFRMTLLFTRETQKTLLTWQMLFESPIQCAEARPFIIPANEENFDRLQTHLSRKTQTAS